LSFVFSDEQARLLLAAGKYREAAEMVIRDLGGGIARHLQALLREDEDARDAYSLWAVDVWKGLPGFRGESSLRSWAYRVARNAALRLRQEAWRRRGRRLRTSEAAVLAEEARRSSLLLREARVAKLVELRQALEPEEQALLQLRLDERLPWNEIADVLGAPRDRPRATRDVAGIEPDIAATYRKRFERISKKLQRMARREGLLKSGPGRRKARPRSTRH
jgi:RNA polymerase sigma-70 factor, ECF subfamily